MTTIDTHGTHFALPIPAPDFNNIPEHLRLAEVLAYQGRHDASQAKYRSLRDQLWMMLSRDPDNPALYAHLATIQTALGDQTDAELSRSIAAYLTWCQCIQ
jgi:hypothetical protein